MEQLDAEITELPLHPEPEVPSAIQESNEREQEELGYPLNVMSNLYYEENAEDGEELIVEEQQEPLDPEEIRP